jgi:hypothetical protein
MTIDISIKLPTKHPWRKKFNFSSKEKKCSLELIMVNISCSNLFFVDHTVFQVFIVFILFSSVCMKVDLGVWHIYPALYFVFRSGY